MKPQLAIRKVVQQSNEYSRLGRFNALEGSHDFTGKFDALYNRIQLVLEA